MKEVSKKLQDCTAFQTDRLPNRTDQLSQHQIQITNLADHLNLVEQVDLVNNLHTSKIEPEFALCKAALPSQDERAQINQQLIVQHEQPKQLFVQQFNENNNYQFNEQNQDKRLRKTNNSNSKLSIEKESQEKDESQEDEFYECTNEEQKDLRKSLFKGSKLNLEHLIDKAIDEQLLGQWLKLSDSLDNEDGPVQQTRIEDLKHKFATKLAIIHYKLYQKYSKTNPIKKWRHRKLNKYNKVQSKYTLLQGLMDDDQFIQFLMDKINYFMRKIRQCKTQRKGLKKSTDKLDHSFKFFDFKPVQERKLKQQLEFDKGSLKDELALDENNNKIKDENNNDTQKTMFDENGNEIVNEQLDSASIELELDKLNEIKKEIESEIIKDLNEEFSRDKELDNEMRKEDKEENELDGIKEEFKSKGLPKYTILFIFTLIIFMIFIVLFRWISFSDIKKCTNCVRNLDSNQLILKPVSQLKQPYLPQTACDQKILMEAQKLFSP